MTPYYADNTVRQNLLHEFAIATLNPKAKRNISVLAETPEEHRDNLLYLFRFVYQIAYGIKTLEEAIERKNIAKECPLYNLVMNYPRGESGNYNRATEAHGIYLMGLDEDIIITDIETILKIVYNKWDFKSNYMDIFKTLVEDANKSKGRTGKKKEEFDKINKLILSSGISIKTT